MKRFKHSLSHYRLATMNMGELRPVGCVEVLPGDTFRHQPSALIRVSPLVSPVMHPVQVRLHSFYVPNRLVWDGWEDFITGESSDTVPTKTLDSGSIDLADGLGCPPETGLEVNDLPFRAYRLIYNEFYRDQDLVTEVADTDYGIQKIAWEKDYFTGARPWAQKGGSITVPIGDQAPVKGIAWQNSPTTVNPSALPTTNGETEDWASGASSASNAFWLKEDPDNSGHPDVYADLASATGIDIRDLREAFALQRYAEARARYGSRFVEYLRYAFGVRSSDSRLGRPEYLGGGRQTISFSEVLQTAPGTGSYVGSLGGHGIAAMRAKRYMRFFEEHGYIITLMSVRPKAMYTQALHKTWLRQTKEDYFQRELQHVGQQEVYNKEVYPTHSNPDDVFGYQDRYREYLEQPSMVSGDFRSLLDHYHLARDFSSDPALNQSFIECDPSGRIFNDSGDDTLWCMVNHNLQARRAVQRSSIGRII